MLTKKDYVKPDMIVRSITSSESVANDCWSPAHDTQNKGYYNDVGFGGIQFSEQSTGESCGAVFTIFDYYNNQGNPIGWEEYLSHHPNENYGNTQASLDAALRSEIHELYQGSEGGQSFKSKSSRLDPNPPSKWSL